MRYFPCKWAGGQEDDYITKLMEVYAMHPEDVPERCKSVTNNATPVECGVRLMALLEDYIRAPFFHELDFPTHNIWRLEQTKGIPRKQYQHLIDSGKVHGDFFKYRQGVPIFDDWEMFCALLAKYLR